MRCLTLARALRERRAEVEFICRPHEGNFSSWIEKNGFTVHYLSEPVQHTRIGGVEGYEDWLGVAWRTDADQTVANVMAMERRPDWLLVDHYSLDHRWEKALRAHVKKILVVDDLANRRHDCDILLDQNLVADQGKRYNGLVSANCKLLLGTSFALLQPMYRDLHDRMTPRTGPIRRILVYFGGVDALNLTGRTISAFRELGAVDVSVDIILPGGHKQMALVQQQVEGVSGIKLHSGLQSLAPLMFRADLAVGAAGATSWERLCLTLPAIVATLAENQRPIAAELDRRNLVRWLGDAENVTTAQIRDALGIALNSGADGLGIACDDRLVDGKGVDRVCLAMSDDAKRGLHVRPISVRDIDGVISIGTALPTDLQFFPRAVKSEPERYAWLLAQMRDIEDIHMFTVEATGSVLVGLVRIYRLEGVWNISSLFEPALEGHECDSVARALALTRLRELEDGAISFGIPGRDRFKLGICSDRGSWINGAIARLVDDWTNAGHQVSWVTSDEYLPSGDICFYLSYSRVVDGNCLRRYRNNLVVHASDLPKGRGWSPLSWQILEGKCEIPIVLFEAAESVDSGCTYLRRKIQFAGHELIDELRDAISHATVDLCQAFVADYPDVLRLGSPQEGDPTYYPRRRPRDSELDVDRTLREQFELLRIADPNAYPAWFAIRGRRFAVRLVDVGPS